MNDMVTPPPIAADTLLAVKLQAQEWEIILRALDETPILPMRLARPVFDKILAQVQRAQSGGTDVPN